MSILNNSGVPTKSKIYRTVEKYRKPGQYGIVNAEVGVTNYIRTLGLVKVRINSFDGIPWFIVARLGDIIELHLEGKINVINMNITNTSVHINDPYTMKMFAMNKRDIKIVPFRNIPHAIVIELENTM
jgi:hypothetical protein